MNNMATEDIVEKTVKAPKGVKDLDKELSEFNQTTSQVQSAQKIAKKSTVKKTQKPKKSRNTGKVFIEKGKRKAAVSCYFHIVKYLPWLFLVFIYSPVVLFPFVGNYLAT